MKDILTRLLDTELEAQHIVDAAHHQGEREIEDAISEISRAEQRVEKRMDDIHRSYTEKAEAQAKTHIDEIERRFIEREEHLVQLSDKFKQQAIDDVVALILNTDF